MNRGKFYITTPIYYTNNKPHLGHVFEVVGIDVQAHSDTFAAFDFGPLCPIPGSQSFRYLTNLEVAEAKTQELGLRII